MRSKGLTLVTLAIVVILWESSFACEITYVPILVESSGGRL